MCLSCSFTKPTPLFAHTTSRDRHRTKEVRARLNIYATHIRTNLLAEQPHFTIPCLWTKYMVVESLRICYVLNYVFTISHLTYFVLVECIWGEPLAHWKWSRQLNRIMRRSERIRFCVKHFENTSWFSRTIIWQIESEIFREL